MASTHQLKIQDLFSVKGYVCLVTGGGTGIGLMATQALAANGMNATPLSIPELIGDLTSTVDKGPLTSNVTRR